MGKYGDKNNMPSINKIGIEIIKTFEGFRDKIYICPGGYKTIGYGHKIQPSENFNNITREDAEEILYKDLECAQKGICRYIEVDLNDNQFSALASFTFNLGVGSLQRSTLRQKINYRSSSCDEICGEFSKWVYSRGRKLPGLIHRRNIESMLYCL